MEGFVSVGDAGRALKLGPDRVRDLCDQGKLRLIRHSNGTRLIPAEALDEYERRQGKKPRRAHA
jgi:hypothetical protein